MKKILIFGFIIAGLAGLVGWKSIQQANKTVFVDSYLASEQTLSESILASGHLVFDKQIKIRSEVTGVVAQVLVEEGQIVEKGQVLLQLDPKSFEADVANNQASVNAQQIEIELLEEESIEVLRQLNSSQKLYKQSILSKDRIQRQESSMKIAQIKIKAAKERLNQKIALLKFSKARLQKTTFIAPMSGLISEIDVKNGETVITGSTNILGSSLMTLADPKTILAELRVDEADIAHVQPGQAVEIFTSAFPQDALNGKVYKIGTSARSNGLNQGLYFYVKVLIEHENKLFPGMSCRAEIITANTGLSLIVPISAIQKNKGRNYVWLIEKNQAKKQIVTVGMANDTHQVITTGLILNDRVVIGPDRAIKNLQDGTMLSDKKG